MWRNYLSVSSHFTGNEKLKAESCNEEMESWSWSWLWSHLIARWYASNNFLVEDCQRSEGDQQRLCNLLWLHRFGIMAELKIKAVIGFGGNLWMLWTLLQWHARRNIILRFVDNILWRTRNGPWFFVFHSLWKVSVVSTWIIHCNQECEEREGELLGWTHERGILHITVKERIKNSFWSAKSYWSEGKMIATWLRLTIALCARKKAINSEVILLLNNWHEKIYGWHESEWSFTLFTSRDWTFEHNPNPIPIGWHHRLGSDRSKKIERCTTSDDWRTHTHSPDKAASRPGSRCFILC